MAIWLLRCVPWCHRSRSSPPLILLNKNHFLISARQTALSPTMSVHIEAVITRPRPPWLLPPRPCGAIMGKGKTRAYLSARGYDRRGRGGLYWELCLISWLSSRSLSCRVNIYLKPNQTGWRSGSGGVERGGSLDKLNFHTNKEEVGGKKTFEAR